MKLDNGYWLLDIARSQTLCVLNCFVAWHFYTQHGLRNALDPIRFAKIKEAVSKDLSLGRGHVFIHQIDAVHPHEFAVLFDDDEIVQLNRTIRFGSATISTGTDTCICWSTRTT